METGLYVALSGQIALQRRLDTIANNVANSSTPGFRAENTTFESLISKSDRASVAYSSSGETTFAGQAGATTQTGNPLDIAIKGEAFLAIATPTGTAYTRDGRMQISTAGDLETISGRPILDIGGAPLQIDPQRGPIEILGNGTITQNGNTVGRLGLFLMPGDAKTARYEGSAFTTTAPVEPVTDYSRTGVVQGFIEGANVNPVLEMSRLIAVTRAFEALSNSIEQSDRKMSDAIRTLGGGQG